MTTEPKRLIIIAPIASFKKSVRLRKLSLLLRDHGVEAELWCWSRLPEEDLAEDALLPKRVLLEGGGYANGGLVKFYLRWMFCVAKQICTTGREGPYFTIGFWSTLPTSYLARRKGLGYLFDNNDNMSMSYPFPKWVKPIVWALEKRLGRKAKIHMVPSKYRWPYADANVRFLPNTPSRDGMEKAARYATDHDLIKDSRFTVYLNGLLNSERGIQAMLGAAKLLNDIDFRILIAGVSVSPEAEELIHLPQTEYVGSVANEAALAYYKMADVVMTMYDPIVEINRLAEPNKWGDCIVQGTPFIVNSEVVTAKPFIDDGACFAVPYHDHTALANLLRKLMTEPEHLIVARAALAKYEAQPWEDAAAKILREWGVLS